MIDVDSQSLPSDEEVWRVGITEWYLHYKHRVQYFIKYG
jgi:hypothetical protein